MAWQIKVKFSGKSFTVHDKLANSNIRNLFDQYVVDGKITSFETYIVDETTKIQTIVYKDKATYDTYRSDLLSIESDSDNFNGFTVEMIEQTEV